MEKELLFSALGETDAFHGYLQCHPILAQAFVQHSRLIEQTRDSETLPDLLAGRDAAAALYMIASEAGFEALAALFYLSYEAYCRLLMDYL